MKHPLSFFAAALFLAACGGKVVFESSGAGGAGVGGAGSSSIVTGPTTTTAFVSSGTTTFQSSSVIASSGTGPDPCAGQVGDPCYQCCVDNHPAEYFVFVTDVINLCACQSPMQLCAVDCSTGCKDANSADQSCYDCLNNVLANGDQCGPDAQNQCFSQPDCAPVLECFSNCQ